MKASKYYATQSSLMLCLNAFYNQTKAFKPTLAKRFYRSIFIIDNPGNYAGLKAEIIAVEAYVRDMGWIRLHPSTQMVHVLQLINGKEILLVSHTDTLSYEYAKLKINTINYLLNGVSGERFFSY